MSEDNQEAQPTVTVKKTKWQKFAAAFDRGIVAVVAGFILGIIGTLVLTWYFQEERKLSYAISPTRTPILKTGKLSNLKVRYEARTERVDLVQTNPFANNPNFVGPVSVRSLEFQDHDITNDLTGVQIAVWNAGNRPIHSNDILLPIILHAADNSTILEASIKGTNSGTEMSIRHGLVDNVIKLDWRVLEKNNGGLITIFYEGSENVDFVLDGKIEGQGSPVKVMTGQDHIISTIILFIIVGVTTIGGITFAELITNKRKSKRLKLSLGIVLLILVSSMAHWLPKWLTVHTPFGF